MSVDYHFTEFVNNKKKFFKNVTNIMSKRGRSNLESMQYGNTKILCNLRAFTVYIPYNNHWKKCSGTWHTSPIRRSADRNLYGTSNSQLSYPGCSDEADKPRRIPPESRNPVHKRRTFWFSFGYCPVRYAYESTTFVT